MLLRRHSLSRYVPPSSDLLRHFRITCGETPRGFERLHCLLARAWADGRFELLNPGWDDLGYSREALAGRHVSELIALAPKAAHAAMKSLLSEEGSLEFGLRCSDRHEVPYHWHRQFDDFTTSMFVVADELPGARITGAYPRGGAPRRQQASNPRLHE